jgi:hypothetical protein
MRWPGRVSTCSLPVTLPVHRGQASQCRREAHVTVHDAQSADFDLANIMHDAARASGALSTTAQKARAATCAGV